MKKNTACRQATGPRRILLLMAAVLVLSGLAKAETLVWSEEFDSGPALETTVWS